MSDEPETSDKDIGSFGMQTLSQHIHRYLICCQIQTKQSRREIADKLMILYKLINFIFRKIPVKSKGNRTKEDAKDKLHDRQVT